MASKKPSFGFRSPSPAAMRAFVESDSTTPPPPPSLVAVPPAVEAKRPEPESIRVPNPETTTPPVPLKPEVAVAVAAPAVAPVSDEAEPEVISAADVVAEVEAVAPVELKMSAPEAVAVEPAAEAAPVEVSPAQVDEVVTPPVAPVALTSVKSAAAKPVAEAVKPKQGRGVTKVPVALPMSKGRKTVLRADGRELRRVGVYLDVPLAKQLTVFAAEQGLDISDIVATALEKFLNGK